MQARDRTLKDIVVNVCVASARLGLLGCGLASVLGSFGGLWWFFDLLSHFRVQYAWLLLAITGVLLAASCFRWAAVAGAAMALNLSVILPLYWGSAKPVDSSRSTLSLVVFNVNYNNSRYSDVAEYVARQNADVIIIIEATPAMRDVLTPVLSDYEMIGYPRDDAFGMLLFSRPSLQNKQELNFGDNGLLSLAAEVHKGGEIFSVLGIHTMPPVGADSSELRDRMMSQANVWAESVLHPIVVGDLNATPWSSAFRSMEDGTLHNTQIGFGLQTSWPNRLWPLSIPIDHGLIGKALTTVSRQVGPFVGSDHRALLLEVGFHK